MKLRLSSGGVRIRFSLDEALSLEDSGLFMEHIPCGPQRSLRVIVQLVPGEAFQWFEASDSWGWTLSVPRTAFCQLLGKIQSSERGSIAEKRNRAQISWSHREGSLLKVFVEVDVFTLEKKENESE